MPISEGILGMAKYVGEGDLKERESYIVEYIFIKYTSSLSLHQEIIQLYSQCIYTMDIVALWEHLKNT